VVWGCRVGVLESWIWAITGAGREMHKARCFPRTLCISGLRLRVSDPPLQYARAPSGAKTLSSGVNDGGVTLVGVSLGCLERINFSSVALGCIPHMGGKVASTVFPFECRVRTSRAVPARGKFRATATSGALVDDVMAGAAVEGATFGGHKYAFRARLCSCTVHGNHPLSLLLCRSALGSG